jgi:hypothetical protein
MRRTALQQLKEDDPLVQLLVKSYRKINRVAGALKENMIEQTQAEADYLAETAKEAVEAYEFDWQQYSETIGDLAEISNKLRELDEPVSRWIEFLDDQYTLAMEADLKATELDYPDDHPVFKLVDLIEEALNLKVD